jgi:hypothetical protein
MDDEFARRIPRQLQALRLGQIAVRQKLESGKIMFTQISNFERFALACDR